MSRRVELGGPEAAAAAPLFRAVGLEVEVLDGPAAARLRELDRQRTKYLLVHVGADDGEPEGSYARAHHRIEFGAAADLAERVRPREHRLIRCLAFGYKNGAPDDATWVVDVRFLDNPYWVEELRPLDGRAPEVRDYVLRQPSAVELMDRLESMLRWCIPLYQRDDLTIAFGCTGGRHRSVVLAEEMARRLKSLEGCEVTFEARDL
ncbi:MAG TPA: RNase adapter RapZ [Candidatus Dormibacteraeota bacterium]